ncbi:2-phospho-L-lactate transferase [Neptuniibacter halophilus]|uniref:2-phospho-L-lactate transferase n=1 Tax=Neptuniibacter halophilus TaxID=651666 RepID=UPI0025733ED2|nr:2-phospho-L-lactate transferase [Neptuniibacter halophilus]
MNAQTPLKILLLSGGVGGAKMAEGFAYSRYAAAFSVLGNVADDQMFHGLWVSPDIDTLTYTLSEQIDREKGWGLKGETNRVLEQLKKLGSDTWMYLGDQDFATHIFRTELRQQGVRASEIARKIAASFGLELPILLPTDDTIQTRVRTTDGWIPFQDYFVKQGCQPEVLEVRIEGINEARPTPEAISAIAEADLIVIAPSNPIVSINPILSVPGIADALLDSTAFKVAVSPIVAGKTVKGPADRMMQVAGHSADVLGVADYYRGLIDALIIDQQDLEHLPALDEKIANVLATDTLMFSRTNKVRLAETIVHLYEAVAQRKAAKARQRQAEVTPSLIDAVGSLNPAFREA